VKFDLYRRELAIEEAVVALNLNSRLHGVV